MKVFEITPKRIKRAKFHTGKLTSSVVTDMKCLKMKVKAYNHFLRK